MKKYRILGVSSGQGALLYPFKSKKNCEIIANVECRSVFHTSKEEQWKLNFGNIPFIKKGFPEDWKPNVIVGSPDCGASSTMRLSKVKELGNPEKNKSLNLLIEAIQKYKPEYFLIENLPRLLNLLPKDFFEKVFPEYFLTYHIRSVADFGNSQVSRVRLILIGTRSSESKNKFSKVTKVTPLKFTKGILDYSRKGPRNLNYQPKKSKTLAMYDYRLLPEKKNLTVRKIHKLWNEDFKNEKKWPIKTAKMSTLPGVYRLEADKYPLTVRPSDRQFRPDGWPLGLQDFKNIMGFPDSFQIYMDKENYQYWLNKGRYTLCKGSVYQVGLWFSENLN